MLSVLAVADARTIQEIDALIAYTGIRVTGALIDRLVTRGLIRVEAQRLHLTSKDERSRSN